MKTAYQIADELEERNAPYEDDTANFIRQQQAEIEALTSYVIDYRDEYVPFINWAANRKAQKK